MYLQYSHCWKFDIITINYKENWSYIILVNFMISNTYVHTSEGIIFVLWILTSLTKIEVISPSLFDWSTYI